MLLFDTNKPAEPMFLACKDDLDYLLLQKYGGGADRVQALWDTYEGHIPPEIFLPGFSFYEERAPYSWGDTVRPFESSPAYEQASWEPATGHKAGLFAYALDRDGVLEGDDTIYRTTYEWSKHLHQVANGTYVQGSFTGE